MMWMSCIVVVVMMLGGVLGQPGGGACPVTNTPVDEMCTSIKLTEIQLDDLQELCQQSNPPTRGSSGRAGPVPRVRSGPSAPCDLTQVQCNVLRELCLKGRQHLLKKDDYDHFAVMNLHRDACSDQVSWSSGDARDVFRDRNWFVDDKVALTNGYSWYRHGLPIWPLPNQTFGSKRSWRKAFRKSVWPNYAIAAPLSVVTDRYAGLYIDDLRLAIRKFFKGDIDTKGVNKADLDKFSRSSTFMEYVENFCKRMFTSQDGSVPADVTVNTYKQWLQPVMKESLHSMIKSYKSKQKRRGSSCPQVVYVFLQQEPRYGFLCHLAQDLQVTLKGVKCADTTRLVVGFNDLDEE
ncbi:uncharacterized protein LOC121861431 isoform X2 [Homarus americanus]|uniref:Uncharacterized protein n=3 Tax=Homarus americanus TaxID=6706 RepID=A0A8J5N3G0_HOMAM|nr:uncharacterized protein LOC121861431 isoform X2 [Homarus americanus]KAG7172642.1 hypothetical protein Hamer_G006856 [Homarus americanus]